jgi:hypothetical protein
LRKWLCPKSWYRLNGFGSAESIPLPTAMIFEPARRLIVTLLLSWIVRARYVPAGKSTMPPGAALAAAMALSMAGESTVVPLPFAP